ncbi:hypothetical protein AXG93_3822s1360 [Marchantia polymorpha subsp. ruderalis]|uniref:Uncharacterized protein n=1 Tax=Marchantia polymorpha subsp. ruderalis TaxID=1480154 RepID=A0A176WKA7_MARPO|nr:hypothetical protein AXG93_3822s1360 [Marchantia polymorpha subsp. ruderalis]
MTKPRIEEGAHPMELDSDDSPTELPTAAGTWFPYVNQVVEGDALPSAGSKPGKMKARARARAKDKPAARSGLDCGSPSAPPAPARKSQRARQVPVKFRALVPRPLCQKAVPAFVHPPNASGIQSLQVPHSLMVPFPPIPVPTPPVSSAVSPPSPSASGSLHFSTFPRIIDQASRPTSLPAATPAVATPRSRSVPAERRRVAGANKRGAAARKKPSPRPSRAQAFAPAFQIPCSHSPNGIAQRTPAACSCFSVASQNVGLSPGGTLTSCGPSCPLTRLLASSFEPCGGLHISAPPSPASVSYRSEQLPSLSRGDGASTSSPPCGEKVGASSFQRPHSARKPPLYPHGYRTSIGKNLPAPLVLSRSFARVPPPPSHERFPIIPSRASLNNRPLGFPKPMISNSQSVPWLVPPPQDSSQQNGGEGSPGQTRSQQKRRLRSMRDGLGKKLQNLLQQMQGGQRHTTTPLKQIIITEEQRIDLVNQMIELCRENPGFRSRYLDAVKMLSIFGVLQTSSYHLIAQGRSTAAQEVLNAYKNQQSQNNESSASASINFYNAVNKVHEEGDVAMQKLPNLKEAGSCSLSKRNDGAWCITLPDEKKRKLNG